MATGKKLWENLRKLRLKYKMKFFELENYFKQKKVPKFRKGVSTLIMNSKSEFLLVNLESFSGHFFVVPGGGLESGETLEDVAYREIEEELGIKNTSLELIGKSEKPLQFMMKTKKLHRDGIEYDGSERYFFGFKFIGNDNEIKLQEGEIRSYKWVSYENLKDYLLFDHQNQLEDTSEKIREIFKLVNPNI